MLTRYPNQRFGQRGKAAFGAVSERLGQPEKGGAAARVGMAAIRHVLFQAASRLGQPEMGLGDGAVLALWVELGRSAQTHFQAASG